MFSAELEEVVSAAFRNARELRHEIAGVEDLLLALLGAEDVREAIVACNGDVALLKNELIRYITENAKILEPADERETEVTLGFQRVLQRAVYHAQSTGKDKVTPLGALVAIFGEKDSHAVYFLNQQDITRLDIVNYVSHGISRNPKPSSVEIVESISKSAPLGAIRSKPKLHVFISYSHKDRSCHDRLRVHLKPLERTSQLDCWSDTRIQAGDRWRNEIAQQVGRAAVAVLLVSADFLASDFIVNQELQPLLIKAESNGTRIIPVVLKHCGFARDSALSNFQCINDPKTPLMSLPEIDQERV
ncbi:MAG TPA: TIR domain-containing protein [Pseudoxanthomonas sp.]|nr:TIR domain-containing protein [Pseudoxanthomonas sp.]